MLSEIEDVRQVPGEEHRRWFTDENMDLIFWYDAPAGGGITGFQLCFDKKSVQRCLTWQAGRETLLSADGRYSRPRVRRIFKAASDRVPEELRSLVLDVLSGTATKTRGSLPLNKTEEEHP